MYRMSGATARASIRGSSVVPGLPKTHSTSSWRSTSRNASFPVMNGIDASRSGQARSLPSAGRAPSRTPQRWTALAAFRCEDGAEELDEEPGAGERGQRNHLEHRIDLDEVTPDDAALRGETLQELAELQVADAARIRGAGTRRIGGVETID